ncbi:hypothetical protein BHM03_00054505 [Ensete ventricosum]|nr:hypothetical protein BHM03_00054505 [Ensete ventricosum]
MSYGVFGVLRQSVDQGLDPIDPRFSFFLRALYPKDPSLALVEFLQARFKNIETGFHRCKSLFVALFPVGAPDCASLLTKNIQLHVRLVHYRAPYERLQLLASEFALAAHLQLLGAKV